MGKRTLAGLGLEAARAVFWKRMAMFCPWLENLCYYSTCYRHFIDTFTLFEFLRL